jgi:hypothetical protein
VGDNDFYANLHHETRLQKFTFFDFNKNRVIILNTKSNEACDSGYYTQVADTSGIILLFI